MRFNFLSPISFASVFCRFILLSSFVFQHATARSSNIEVNEMSTLSPHRFAVGSPLPHFTLDVKGVSLAVHDSNPNSILPVLLCLHAIGHGGGDFRAVIDHYSNRYRVVTLDWPGQGFSGQDDQPASATRYAELLEEVVQQMKFESVIVLGNSIGGAAAIRYTAKHPDKVRALILSNPGGLDSGGQLASAFLWWMEQKFLTGARNEPKFKSWFHGYYGKVLVTVESQKQRELIEASAYEIAPRLAEAWKSFRSNAEDLKPLVSKITVPVLFAWAKKDQFVSWERNKKAVQSFPNKKIVFFEAGHSPFLETPQEFIKELDLFLK
jgi:pimeloyl-ACP methyl ester carboxylesterase